jgi:hypothetical protein
MTLTSIFLSYYGSRHLFFEKTQSTQRKTSTPRLPLTFVLYAANKHDLLHTVMYILNLATDR